MCIKRISVISRILCMSLALVIFLHQVVCPVMAVEDPVLDSMVRIKARPDFSFRYDPSNSSSGEHSPINAEYYLSKYKVTNAQYKEFTDATGYKTPGYWTDGTYPGGKDDHPVVNVSFSDAQAYCVWLSSQYDGWIFRLPTEAEWENAAMGSYYSDLSVKYPSDQAPSYNATTNQLQTDFNYNAVIASKLIEDYGSDYMITYIKGDYAGTSEELGQCIQISKTGGVSNWANHGGNASRGYFLQTDLYAQISADGGYTTPVGSYNANSLGLYDMAGNCWDLTSSQIVAENGLEAGVTCYAVRGGSWYATARSCTFSYRGEGRKDHPSATVGFRVAADAVDMTDVQLSIDTVNLRPSEAGIYFSASFAADWIVKRQGVTLSTVNSLPVADGTDETCLWTESGTSVLVTNILSAENDIATNAINGTTYIYARPYVQGIDGTFLYGDVVAVSLRDVVQTIDSQMDQLTSVQREAIIAMYGKFESVMDSWTIPNMKKQAVD